MANYQKYNPYVRTFIEGYVIGKTEKGRPRMRNTCTSQSHGMKSYQETMSDLNVLLSGAPHLEKKGGGRWRRKALFERV